MYPLREVVLWNVLNIEVLCLAPQGIRCGVIEALLSSLDQEVSPRFRSYFMSPAFLQQWNHWDCALWSVLAPQGQRGTLGLILRPAPGREPPLGIAQGYLRFMFRDGLREIAGRLKRRDALSDYR